MNPVVRLALATTAILLTPALHAAGGQVASPPANPSSLLTRHANGVDFRKGAALIRVTALTDDILRVRIGRDGNLPEDASWAVPAPFRARHVAVKATDDGFTTAHLRFRVDRNTLKTTVETLDGKVISADADNSVDVEGSAFTVRKALPQDEHYYGLGDKTGGTLDRRGRAFVDWNTDFYAFGSSSDPIYKSIPFFIGVGGPGGSYGILLDNTWRTWFDFGQKDAETLAFGGPDGPIDYYLVAGPSTAEVVRRYTDLTGKAPMPPSWALGFQQSRYSYMSAEEVRSIAARLQQDKIPTDVIWLDIDYQDRNRPFTIDAKTFPDFKGLVSDMGKKGIKLVAITDLHVAMAPNQGYRPYDTGAAGNHFVHNPDGTVFVGKVWPGPSVFPDFTDTKARAWWGTQFKSLLSDGVVGFWNDMNEPSVFETPTKTMPLDSVHHIGSDDFAVRDATHAEIHNVFGMENTRATYEGVKTLAPNERAFVMTRASYAGGQRYAVTWTGDNSSTWDHLKLSIHQQINLGLSGFSWSGADVGGFTGGPSADLLTRWTEIGAFTPIFRAHAEKGSPRAELWVDGPEHLAIRRRFIEERYRLMPYLYALADQNARLGDPIMRPVFYDYPDALNATCNQEMDFTLGRDLLIAPPPKPESPQQYQVCLPAGGWYDYWTGMPVNGTRQASMDLPVQSADQTLRAFNANSNIVMETPKLDRLPVFVRAGSILPRQPLVQSTAETPQGALSVDVYPGSDCEGTLYADDGHSMAFQKVGYLRQKVRCTMSSDGVSITFDRRDGQFKPWWKTIAVTVHGWEGAGTAARQGRSIATQVDAAARTIAFTMNDQPGSAQIDIVRR